MKYILRRVAAAVIAVGAATVVAVGCNGKTEDKSVETVNVWMARNHIEPTMKREIEKYNNTVGKEKGIHIEYTCFSTEEYAYDMSFATGKEPELYQTSSYQSDIDKGWMIAIDDMPGGKEYLKEKNIVSSKETYTLPVGYTNTKLVYNKDLFKKNGIVDENGEAKAPKTWEEAVAYAKIITDNGGGEEYGIALPMARSNYFWEWEIMRPMQRAIGNCRDEATGKYDFSGCKKMLECLLEIKSDGSYVPNPQSLTNDAARMKFAAGKVGMKLATSWDMSVYNNVFKAECDWGAVDVPLFEGGEAHDENIFCESSVVVLSRAAKKMKDPSKAFEVFKFFNSDEFKRILYEDGMFLMDDENVVGDLETPQIKGWTEFNDIDMTKTTTEIVFASSDVDGGNYVEVFDKIWFGELTDLDEAIEVLNRNYNK